MVDINSSNNFVLSCCSTVDLNLEELERRNISYLPFHYFLDNKEYVDDFGKTIPMKKFYDEMVKGKMTKTSQISVGEYVNYFTEFARVGKDVLHLTLSSGISGTINNANEAVKIVKKTYPNFKIYIVDSLAASSGYGLLMSKLSDYKKEGHSLEETKDYALSLRLKINHWFFSTDLTFYIRGGRVSKTSGNIANMLHICPLLNVSNEGKLIVREKVLGEKKCMLRIVQKMIENADDGLEYSDYCYISHSDILDVAAKVKDLIEEKFPHLKRKVKIFDIGTTIGAHTGPGTLALFFVGKERTE